MNERAKEVAEVLRDSWGLKSMHIDEAIAWLSSLPEFAWPKWIKCSERMPLSDRLVMTHGPFYYTGYPTSYSLGEKPRFTHWMELPQPPAEEESALVKAFRAEFNDKSGIGMQIIEFLKRHEGKK